MPVDIAAAEAAAALVGTTEPDIAAPEVAAEAGTVPEAAAEATPAAYITAEPPELELLLWRRIEYRTLSLRREPLRIVHMSFQNHLTFIIFFSLAHIIT